MAAGLAKGNEHAAALHPLADVLDRVGIENRAVGVDDDLVLIDVGMGKIPLNHAATRVDAGKRAVHAVGEDARARGNEIRRARSVITEVHRKTEKSLGADAGQVGQLLSQRLVERGDEVRGVVRSASHEQALKAVGVRPVVIDLEGRELIAVELGHTDTDNTTCLHVPSIGLVVAGDAVYNDVHLYLAESDAAKRQEWLAALDKIDALHPRAVVASHKRPENDDRPETVEETRQYSRDFDRLVATTSSGQQLYEQMLKLYPTRVNPGWALWNSAHAAKP